MIQRSPDRDASAHQVYCTRADAEVRPRPETETAVRTKAIVVRCIASAVPYSRKSNFAGSSGAAAVVGAEAGASGSLPLPSRRRKESSWLVNGSLKASFLWRGMVLERSSERIAAASTTHPQPRVGRVGDTRTPHELAADKTARLAVATRRGPCCWRPGQPWPDAPNEW